MVFSSGQQAASQALMQAQPTAVTAVAGIVSIDHKGLARSYRAIHHRYHRTVNLAAVANTNPFDSAVSSSTGDAWDASVNPNAFATYSPLTLDPGQSGTITLTFTPNAAKGTVVHGFIGVDTFNLFSASGGELINIPYSYKVG